jgi:hypothetical protein
MRRLSSALVGVVVLLAACSDSESTKTDVTTTEVTPTVAPAADEPAGTQTFTDLERTHVDTPVAYPQTPPVGGPHSPVWQNCGFYDVEFPVERGVHSMEHGAVWITYSADLPAADVAVLKGFADSGKEVLVSPFTGLPSPVVASAWGKQLVPDGVNDPRLAQFVALFDDGPQSPELGTPCSQGTSETS